MADPRVKPILFSGSMVRASIEGRKTMTRRIIDLPKKTHSGGPIYEHPKMGGWAATTIGGPGVFVIGKRGERHSIPEKHAIWHQTTGTCVAVSYAVEDFLWVREAWWTDARYDHLPPRDVPVGAPIYYQTEQKPGCAGRYRHGKFMCRWMSRLTMRVTAVKVERLQDISEEDAECEGCEATTCANVLAPKNGFPSYRSAFAILWQLIHGPYSWAANPWVAAISFSVIRSNIDDVLADRSRLLATAEENGR